MTTAAQLSRAAFHAAVGAVNPETVTRAALSGYDFPEGQILVVAIGKAAPAMARGAAQALRGRAGFGIVVSDHDEPSDRRFLALIGDHPIPASRSLHAGRTVLEHVQQSEYALLLVLVSGGASSLVEVPPPGLGLGDVSSVGGALLRSGADIFEINTVRRHLSTIKNGALLRASRSPTITLLMDDVHDGPATAIGSGPTLRDESTSAEAIRILRQRVSPATPDVERTIRYLETAAKPCPAAQPHEYRVVADRSQATDAAVAALRASGVDAEAINTPLAGPATTMTIDALSATPPGRCYVYAGETTVAVTGSRHGGRNHHAALTAALWLENQPGRWFAALGTDGLDGTTPAAGATVDGETAGKVRTLGIDPELALSECASWEPLARVGASVTSGATGTNVGDLWLAARTSSVCN